MGSPWKAGEPLKTWASPARGEQPPPSSCAEPGSVPSGLCRCLPVLEDGTRCQFSVCPQKWVICRKFFSLREDWETGAHQKGKGEQGRGAGLQSFAPGTPAPVSQCYLMLAGSDLLETHRERRVWGQSRGSSTHKHPTAAGLGQHMHRPPAQGPAKQEHLPWTHRGPRK